ncbi:alpha-amylase [Streptomyces sp. NPDC000658]|uniref:alpha-amylase n=1 Tax=Streptomyces sp. NPDC000658 TaxID=3154266 RepID=UPI00332BFFE7
MNRRSAAALVACLTTAAAILGTTGPAHAAAAQTAPPCLTYTSDWRYTFVTNDCSEPHSVQLAYTYGELSPCRQVEPADRITFAGYGTTADYVTELRLC